MKKQIRILKQKNKEANEFIIEIAKMLNIETDGVGYDDIQLSLDDFENAISTINKPSSVPQANELFSSMCEHENIKYVRKVVVYCKDCKKYFLDD